jgi:hypothetical protein
MYPGAKPEELLKVLRWAVLEKKMTLMEFSSLRPENRKIRVEVENLRKQQDKSK